MTYQPIRAATLIVALSLTLLATFDTMKAHILIIDDDTELCEMVSHYLSLEGVSSEAAHDGASGAELACKKNFDIIILDVMLPQLNGFEVLQKIRSQIQTPVIMLTARGEDVDRIIGLERGADDYLPKPFNPLELIARIRAVLRRINSNAPKQEQPAELGGLRVTPASRQALLHNEVMELTSTEFNILNLLIQDKGNVLTKEILSEKALGKPLQQYDRSIDMHISHLRHKLQHQAINTPTIATVRGIGYQLVLAEKR